MPHLDTGHRTLHREISSAGDKGRTQDTGHWTGRFPHLETKGGHRTLDTGHWTLDREVSSAGDKGRTQSSVKCGHRKYVGAELIRGGL